MKHRRVVAVSVLVGEDDEHCGWKCIGLERSVVGVRRASCRIWGEQLEMSRSDREYVRRPSCREGEIQETEVRRGSEYDVAVRYQFGNHWTRAFGATAEEAAREVRRQVLATGTSEFVSVRVYPLGVQASLPDPLFRLGREDP